MAFWTYKVKVTEGSSKGIAKSNSYVSARIYRTSPSSADPSFYKLSANTASYSIGNNTIQTYQSGFNLNFGSYGSIGDLAHNESWHSDSGTASVTSSILNVPYSSDGSSGTDIQLTLSNIPNTGYNCILCGQNMIIEIEVQVEDKYTASSCSVGNVNFGSDSVVTLSNDYIADLTHTVKWTIGSRNSSVTTSQGASTATLSIPAAWMDQVPNTTSISGSVEVKTYRGATLIGTTVGSFTASVPTNVVPSITSITATIKNENAGIPGTYIQNTTGVYLQLNGVQAGTGASMPANAANYPISANLQEEYVFDSANEKYTINTLANGGQITFTVSVIDSRGRRSSSVSCTINVMEYALPVITSASAYRCRQDGVAAEDGTYACIRIVASYTETGGNTMDIDSKYYDTLTPTTLITAQNDMTSGVSYIIGGGLLNTERTYHIKFIVTDTLGNVINKDIIVQSAAYAIHVKNGGSGVAFGKTSEYDNCVEINEGWDFRHMGFIVLPVIYKATAAARDAIQNPPEGLVCLIPKT